MNVDNTSKREPRSRLPARVAPDRSGAMRQMALQRRLDALFRALSSDFLLREQFITDPAQIAAEYVNGKRMDPEDAAAMNYLIYSCLGNNYLISWFRDYSLRHGNERITRQRFVKDFSAAVVNQRAQHVVSSLVHFALSGNARIALDDTWLQAIFGVWETQPADGTDDATDETGTGGTGTDSTGTDSTGTDSTGTDSTGTDSTGTGGTGTDSTGTDSTGTGGTGTDSTGTDSTGTGGTGTDSTGTDGTGTDSTGTDSTGTDSTGTDSTGTDVTDSTLTAITWKTYITDQTDTTHPSTTPFTHTAMTRSPITTETTQNTIRFLGTSHVVVTLEALTSYARQLIRSGALEAEWHQ
ncbi:uncharacterized protein YjbI with pentapeptide repeats [Actimicrobium sp. GrIS 1.19]|uniref:hypothetical protein n=1 Tax=Actimicrobium sp. GrIS 1.19 TaxID=3071708 RepID=UPI002E06E188|nr:uncharacterized protein YjbI with pentapeptide repeats [Actimicrobium sp. GrIS 1.19]